MSEKIERKESPNIAKEIDLFVQNLDGLATSNPTVLAIMGVSAAAENRKLLGLLESKGELKEQNENTKTFTIKFEDYAEVEEAKRKASSADLGYEAMKRSFIVSLVSQFDSYLSRLIQALFSLRPELLDATDRQLSFTELNTFDSIERAREYVLEKEVESVLRKSHSDQFAWMENKFNISLRKDLPSWSTFIELTERRNLFVHCNGVVSNQYMSVCKQHKVTSSDKTELNQVLSVSSDYFKSAYRCIFEIGTKLGQVLWRKLRPDQIAEADYSLMPLTYRLLTNHHNHLACVLLDFACSIPKLSSDEIRRTLIINRAQAYKWKGEQERCMVILNEEDWSASDLRFKLGVAVLSNDFDKASRIMKEMGSTSVVKKKDYENWPLFKEFRKAQQYQSTFHSIFGESARVEETAKLEEEGKLPG